jgi:hypothetical protein
MQKTDSPEEKVTWVIESLCIENKVATLLLKDDKIATAPVQLLLDAFPECMEEDLETYLVSLCSPTLTVECTYQGSELLSLDQA